MSLINTKALCKQIKEDAKKGTVIWAREKERHFISNRHYLVRFTELPEDVSNTLLGIFGGEPEIGKMFMFQYGTKLEPKETINFKSIYRPQDAKLTGSVTTFMKELSKKWTGRIVNFSLEYVCIDEKYYALALDDKAKTISNENFQTVYLADNDLLVMVIKNVHAKPWEIEMFEKLAS